MAQFQGDASCKDTIAVLLDALNDKEDFVNNSVIKSLQKIAASYPNYVLEVFCEFHQKTTKIPDKHLANIVKVLEQTCVNGAKSLDSVTSQALVDAMLAAMTRSADLVPDVQMGASAVLVAVGHVRYDMVLRALINELSAAKVPHYTVPHTLGTLAAVNTHATVPHVKEILSRLIPLLSLVKTDAMKQAFSYAFGHFAVAVSEQIGDNVENENITSIKENFVVEFSVIFDVLFNQWLMSHEPKVTECVLEALGPITRLISERKFNETVNKFVATLLTMYRRPNLNAYMVSQCISHLLSPSPLNPKLTLTDHVFGSINHTLFQLVLLEPDYDQPHSVRNHFEVLRCFDHMAEQLPELTIENLLNQCKNNQERERMKAVIILTHLTTSSQIFVDKYGAKFVNILKVMIANEQSLKMKKVLVKALVGLVYRNCVPNEDFVMVDFIIKHCYLEGTTTVDKNDMDDLQDTCKSSLFLLSNTVTNVRPQLCSLLLKSLVVEEFVGSVITVTQCLNNLLQNENETSNESVEKSNTHLPELIFVRCLNFLIDPKYTDRNKNVLLFLESYSDHIHKNLKLSSNVEMHRMLKYVNKNESEDQWHGMLRDFLTSSLDHINSNKWLESVSVLLSQQVKSVKQDPAVKGVSLQFLAILACQMTNSAVITNVLNLILQSIRTTPLQGCPYVSKAVGIASRKHGNYVLNELDLMYRDVDNKKSSKIFSFISSRTSKTDMEANTMKIVLVECYGKVAIESIDEHVLARLGENVTVMINDILKTSPNLDLTRTCLTSLYEISKALYPAPHHTIVLRNRWQLLNVVLEQLFNKNIENKNVELFPIIVKASKALTKLQKGILPEERNTILRLLFNSIFGELSLLKQTFEKEGNETEHDFLAKTLNDSLNILSSLIKELVIQSTCLSMIDDLVSLLLEWIHNENDDIRSASSNILKVVLDTYIKNVRLNYETPSKFGQMGYLLGLLVPKTTDTNFAVRLSAMENIKLVIQIEDLYDGRTIEPNDPFMKSLDTIHNSVLTNDLKMITKFSVDLSKTICEKIPQQQLLQFIESILECFEDQEYSSTGISTVLNELFKCKGSDLYQSIERVVDIMLATMDRIPSDKRLKLLAPLASLAHHHAQAVTATLLCQPLPLRQCVAECWRHLARDCVLSAAVVDNFLRTMTSIQLFEDPYHITENHIAALQPLTLITALGQMLEEPSMRQLCLDKFPELFSVLYTTLASYEGALPPAYSVPGSAQQERLGFVPNRDAVRMSPAKITLHTFGAFLQQVDCQKMKEACAYTDGDADGWARPSLLAGALCREGAAELARLVAALAPYARAPLPPHRRAAVALCGELLHYRCNDNPVLIDCVFSTLAAASADRAGSVRVSALLGLAGAARLGPARAGAALAALGRAVDTPPGKASENVPLAAMQGLCRLLSDLESVDPSFHRELTSITQKIRPFMNTEDPVLREHSIKLFGVIVSRVKSQQMQELSVNLLPCFLLHLGDDDEAVVRASKTTLKQVLATLPTPRAAAFARAHLVPSGRLLLAQFLSALLALVAKEAPALLARLAAAAAAHVGGRAGAHAALLIDILYSEMNQTDIDLEMDEEVRSDTRARLVQMLRGPSAPVRQHAASALASVCLSADTVARHVDKRRESAGHVEEIAAESDESAAQNVKIDKEEANVETEREDINVSNAGAENEKELREEAAGEETKNNGSITYEERGAQGDNEATVDKIIEDDVSRDNNETGHGED